MNATREPAGVVEGTAGPEPTDTHHAGQAGRRRDGAWNVGFLVLGAVAELGWIGLLVWTAVQVTG